MQITSRQHAGKRLLDIIPRCRGYIEESFEFSPSDAQAIAADGRISLVFLALPHGVASEYARPLLEAGKRVIDLSADFRLRSAKTYQEFYGHPHPAPDLLSKAAYVIPELYQGDLREQQLIAAPGCYPTSIIVPLFPLLKEGVISPEGIVANSISGISGGGKKAEDTYLYCERAESVTAYGIPKHRHLSEIEEQLSQAAGQAVTIQFTPHLAPIKRGIASTLIVKAKQSEIHAVYASWQKYYQKAPFVSILPAHQTPDTANVVRSNRIEMAVRYDPRTKNFVITSAEDNLLKGASGQAVQIMNRCLGYEETCGLV